ncbi:MAG TPA: CPXCG motif-containing cysteine-rich protein [Candidatus Limnocylindria bacterium]|nr:CPXCG motif-containing cysteine-rich protein [Candidatus Limnocylindria bacterium]
MQVTRSWIFRNDAVPSGMVESEEVLCPFCGQVFELAVDTSVASQRFTTDCEVCCRPFEVVAECEHGEILSLDVLSS